MDAKNVSFLSEESLDEDFDLDIRVYLIPAKNEKGSFYTPTTIPSIDICTDSLDCTTGIC